MVKERKLGEGRKLIDDDDEEEEEEATVYMSCEEVPRLTPPKGKFNPSGSLI